MNRVASLQTLRIGLHVKSGNQFAPPVFRIVARQLLNDEQFIPLSSECITADEVNWAADYLIREIATVRQAALQYFESKDLSLLEHEPDFVQCPDCDYSYDQKLESDRNEHIEHHSNFTMGTRIPDALTLHSVAEERSVTIYAVTQRDSQQAREFVRDTSTRANRDLRYDFGIYEATDSEPEQDTHAILAARDNRVIGIVIVRRRNNWISTTWKEYDSGTMDGIVGHEALWSIDAAWVLQHERKNGVATLMITTALRFLHVTDHQFAWTTPFTANGEALARKLSPNSFRL